MSMTVQSVSPAVAVAGSINAPTDLVAERCKHGPKVNLAWTDNATNEIGFRMLKRSTNGGGLSLIGTAPARSNTGVVTYMDLTVVSWKHLCLSGKCLYQSYYCIHLL